MVFCQLVVVRVGVTKMSLGTHCVYFNHVANVFAVSLYSENKQLLQQAKLELKKSKRKDYYKILGVHKTASEDEIKRAYKKRALIHHPGEYTDTVILLVSLRYSWYRYGISTELKTPKLKLVPI